MPTVCYNPVFYPSPRHWEKMKTAGSGYWMRMENRDRRQTAGRGSWGRGQQVASPTARGYGGVVWAPSTVTQSDPDHPKVSQFFQHSGWLLLTL